MLPKTTTILLSLLAALSAAAPAAAETRGVERPPDVQLNCPTIQYEPGQRMLVDFFAMDPDGGDVAISWDMDDDGAYDDPGPDPAWPNENEARFTTRGPHTIRAKAVDDEGHEVADECVVRILDHAPKAVIEVRSTYGFENTTIGLDATGSQDRDGTIVGYEWDLDGDGSYEQSGPKTTVAFPKPGRYPVGLRVTDDAGNTATAQQSLRVSSLVAHIGAIRGVKVTKKRTKRNPAKPHGRFSVNGDVTRIDAFTLTRLPKMAVMDYWCEGSGCFRGTNPVKQLRTRAIFDFPLIGWEMRAGDTILIKVDCPGFKVRTIRITARAGQPPLVR